MALSLLEQVERLLAGPRPLPIVQAGDPVLRRRSNPYDGELPAAVLNGLIAAMRECMLAAPGVGLAGPQVGLGVQLAVIQDSAAVSNEIALARDRRPVPFRVLVNPHYVPVGGQKVSFYEGCLSVTGYQAVVQRAASVRLRGFDDTGATLDEVVTGWPARIVAHETDHLAGRLYLDRALTRSLTTIDNYLLNWNEATVDGARKTLGF